jgi:spectinomycin phosphotransferase
MHDSLSIPEERLRACLRDQYGLTAVTLELLTLGLDTTAKVYRVVSEQGTTYLLKARSGPLYEPSFLVPRYLADQGVTAVNAPIPTSQGALWTRLVSHREWVIAVYPFVDGECGWNPGMSDAQWMATGALVRQIHLVALPPEGFPSLRTETFEPDGYAHRVAAIEARHAQGDGGSQVERALHERWQERQPTIHALLATMDALTEELRARAGPCVICHADLHPSNLIRDHVGRVFLIDWDDVMLAPKERDFLFAGDPPADGAARTGGSPFFQGYGPAEIDWAALAYYRCERIVQDVIECAQEVYFRDDLGEDVKANAVELFAALFAPGATMLDAACAAATHLPLDHNISIAARA